MCLHVCPCGVICMHMLLPLDPLDLELYGVVSCLTWVQRAELQSSVRPICMINH